ncbi:MAG TPA: bifunctional nicotinamidase/pyrazinamidase [Phycisphaerae bacterium]|nr:bifunctional nicotinamidase/pyrazinamidase [Phycisphaerae bacterium]
MKPALIIVDLQNDFVPGGALAVIGGDEIIPLVNQLQSHFDLIVATQDWHPANHGSFAANHLGRRVFELATLGGLPQMLWPIHCVEGTAGAEFVPGLQTTRIKKIIHKGTDQGIDSYSGFFDNGHRKATGLDDYLRAQEVSDVYIVGLATDYCVKFTALDARQLGFETHLIEDACRGVDLNPGDVEQAIAQVRSAGVKVIHGADVLRSDARFQKPPAI